MNVAEMLLLVPLALELLQYKQNSGNKYNVALVNSRKLRLLVKIFNKVIRHF